MAAVVLSLLPVGAAAAVPPSSARVAVPSPALPDGAVVLHGPGALPHVASLALAGGGDLRAHDVTSWLTAAADLAAKRFGAEPVVATTAEEEPDSHDASGSYADATELGDVDGDGAADLLVYNVDLAEYRLTLDAVSGRDGTLLWSRASDGEGGGFAFPLDSDVDGDGAADLVGLRLDGAMTESCTDTGCEWHEDFTWTLTVVSGASGADVWSDSIDGYYHEGFESSSELTAESEHYWLESENLYLMPFLAGDGNGDGTPDVGVNAIDLNFEEHWDYEGLPVLGTETARWSQTSATRAALRSGATGEVIRSLSSDTAPGLSLLLPAGDLVGTAAPDLLWEREGGVGESSYTCSVTLVFEECEFTDGTPTDSSLAAHDVATGEVAWTIPGAGEWSMAWPLDDDLTGDGRAEVMRFIHEGEADTPYVTQAIDGATGAVAWAIDAADDWLFPINVTELDDRPGLDLITAAWVGDTWEDGATVQLDRLSGATGDLLGRSTVTHTLGGESTEDSFHGLFAYAGGTEDFDGDTSGDAVVGFIELVYTWSDDDEAGELTYVASSAQAHSGRSGAPLATLDADHVAYLAPAGDLDGNGTEELFEVHDRDGAFSADVLRHGVAEPAWTYRTSSPYAYLLPVGDQDGAGGGEVVAVADGHDAVGNHTMITSLDGATGTDRWTRRSRP